MKTEEGGNERLMKSIQLSENNLYGFCSEGLMRNDEMNSLGQYYRKK